MASKPGGKQAGGKAVQTVKRTLGLSAETDMKLDVLARRDGLTRSELAERILSAGLRGVVVSFRGALSAGEGGGAAAEGSAGPPAETGRGAA